MKIYLSLFVLFVLIVTGAVLALAQEADADVQAQIDNAVSAGPAEIGEEATVLAYSEEWPGNWPDEPAPALVELRPGSNGWTCIADIPTTPGNDPMCLNETYLDLLKAQYTLIDPPPTGIGIGYMLQGGGPIGSPPHMMIYMPRSNEDLAAFPTDPGPLPWVMFSETPNKHLMVTIPSLSEEASSDSE